MALDPRFSKEVAFLVKESLDMCKNRGKSSRIRQVWGCKNDGDFLCGFFVGKTMTDSLVLFGEMHERAPTMDEYGKIMDLIESHSKEVKKCFGG